MRRVEGRRGSPDARAPMSGIALRRLGTLVALVGVGIASAAAQEPVPSKPAAGGLAAVESQLKRLETVTGMDEAVKAKLVELYGQARDAYHQADDWAAKAADFDKARAEAPDKLKAIQEELSKPPVEPKPEVPKAATLGELEQRLTLIEAEKSAADREEADLEAEFGRRAERRKQIPEILAAARKRQQEAADQLGAAPPAGEAAEVTEARRILADARVAQSQREIDALEKELLSYDARGKLLTLRIDRAVRHSTETRKLLDAWREVVSARRLQEASTAEKEAQAAAAEAEKADPELQKLTAAFAAENLRLSDRRVGPDGVVGKIEVVSDALTRVKEDLARVKSDYATVTSKVATGGLGDTLGLLLRRHRASLPDVGKYRRFVRARVDEIAGVQVEQIELREARLDLANIDRVVERTLARLGPSINEVERRKLERALPQLLTTQRDYLDALLNDTESYFDKLLDLDTAERELITVTSEFLKYIDERILWTPSGEVLGLKTLQNTWPALEWLLWTPRFWHQLARAALTELTRTPLLHVAVAAIFLLAVKMHRRLRARLRELGQQSRKYTCTAYRPTLEALGVSLLLAPWLAAALAYVGWRLGASGDATQYVRALAAGLLTAAGTLLVFRVAGCLLRTGGLVDAHFGWPAEELRRLRRPLLAITAVVTASTGFIAVFESRGEDLWTESLGRIAFIVMMVALCAFNDRLLHPSRGIFRSTMRRIRGHRGRWVERLVYAAGVGVPGLLGLAAVTGYFWTALRIYYRVHVTLVFVFALSIVSGMVLRWLLVAQRRLRIEQVRQRRAALTAESKDAPSEADKSEPTVDLAAIDIQTNRLFRAAVFVALVFGIGVIWSDIFPALGALDRVTLWTTTKSVTLVTQDADGAQRVDAEDRAVPVTLANLAAALLLALATYLTARNLPGVLEISVLRKFGIPTGERYAYMTIFRYIVVLLGVTLAFGAIGIGWSKIQWLVAALGLGLGFGLQEIFANFVSGIIILFERPIRVGDTVTVGTISGTVTKIRIRATWITAFDRKELIVPNKEFVTGQLVNWTLSDPVLRLDIPVGIAYGSNTSLAYETLHRVGREHPLVLKDPPPRVFFLGFGDSSLNFELRVFSPNLEVFLQLRHDLHMEIDRAFREAEIEIAFPQRDLHIRSLPKGVRMARDADAEEQTA
ncbi:MAG: mechanosensitive ion channel [Myxococcales bacterium]|nr:mechanosensitive ion channel [Myxococcales bacterium]